MFGYKFCVEVRDIFEVETVRDVIEKNSLCDVSDLNKQLKSFDYKKEFLDNKPVYFCVSYNYVNVANSDNVNTDDFKVFTKDEFIEILRSFRFC